MIGVSSLGSILSACALFSVLIRSDATATSEKPANYGGIRNHPQRRSTPARSCETEQLENRLKRLEVRIEEKSEDQIAELRESNRRLQELEMHISDIQQTVGVFSSELAKITEYDSSTRFQQVLPHRSDNEKLEKSIENLSNGMQLVVASLRSLDADIAWVKKNVSKMALPTSDFGSIERFSTSSTNPCSPKNTSSGSSIPRHCREIYESGNSNSGIYQIKPEYVQKPFLVFCDMETRGGGWTYIQNRFDGSQDFSLDWNDYKSGFGNIGGEFWLGLEHIHQLTGNDLNELLVELEDFDKRKVYAHYTAFGVGSEKEEYALKVLGGYSGDAGDSLMYHAGSRFSTRDRDQDKWLEGNCARAHGGAWWYRSCDTSNLNGGYLEGDLPEHLVYQGMYWADFRGSRYSLAEARMMVRPRGGDRKYVETERNGDY